MLYRKVHSAKIIWYEKIFIIFLAPCSASKSPNSKRRFLKKNRALFYSSLSRSSICISSVSPPENCISISFSTLPGNQGKKICNNALPECVSRVRKRFLPWKPIQQSTLRRYEFGLCNVLQTPLTKGGALKTTSDRFGLPLSGTVPYTEQFPEYNMRR